MWRVELCWEGRTEHTVYFLLVDVIAIIITITIAIAISTVSLLVIVTATLVVKQQINLLVRQTPPSPPLFHSIPLHQLEQDIIDAVLVLVVTVVTSRLVTVPIRRQAPVKHLVHVRMRGDVQRFEKGGTCPCSRSCSYSSTDAIGFAA